MDTMWRGKLNKLAGGTRFSLLEAKKETNLWEVPLEAVGFSGVEWVEELTCYSFIGFFSYNAELIDYRFIEFMLLATKKLISSSGSVNRCHDCLQSEITSTEEELMHRFVPDDVRDTRGEPWHHHATAVTVAPEFRRQQLAKKLTNPLGDIRDKM
ncbi:hypothetical protein Tco_0396734 [Tanacetum coccineum]